MEREAALSEAIYRATESLGERDLFDMALAKEDLPDELNGFQVAREGVLDNESMATHGFPGITTGGIRSTGRITGYIREFVTVLDPGVLQPGCDVIAATVVHLFQDGGQVSRWMKENFLGEFKRFVGKDLGDGQHLMGADEVRCDGFSEEAVGLRTVQTTSSNLVSSNVVDFRLGRLLGVAYVVALGDVDRERLAGQFASRLETRIVRVVLGAS